MSSVSLKIEREDFNISMELSNEFGYDVNMNGILSTLEDFISKIELYDTVKIEISKDSISHFADDDIPVSNNGKVSFSTINDMYHTQDNQETTTVFRP